MPKGTPITIAGSAYPRNPKRRISNTKSRKRRSTSGDATTGYSQHKKIVRLEGSGDYVYRYKGATPFAGVGRHVGKYFGFGDWGEAIGHGIGRILGSGDYQTGPMVKSNVLVNSTEVPQFSDMGRANVIAHREYLGDLITSPTPGAFLNRTFTINPGLSNSFPWLSTIAQNYEQYKVHGMVFYFKTTSGDSVASTNTALGTVIMATDYNVNASPYQSKTEMENSQFAQSCKPSMSAMHGIECAPSELPLKNYYVRTGDIAASDSIKWYDMANFQIATQGFQSANVNVGEIWVTYLIEFFKPQIPRSVGGTIGSERIVRRDITNLTPFGSIALSQTGNLITAVTPTTVTVSEVVSNQLYSLTFMWVCTAAAAWTAPVLTFSGCAPVALASTNTGGAFLSSSINPSNGVATSTEFAYTQTVQVNQVNTAGSFTISTAGWTGPANTSNFCTILITQLDNALIP